MSKPEIPTIQNVTAGRAVRCAAERAPEKVAISFEDRSLTYRDLADRISRVAALSSEKWELGAGDRVVLLAPNCIEYAELLFGLTEMGVVVATLNPSLTSSELKKIVADCDPTLVIAHNELRDVVDSALPSETFGGNQTDLIEDIQPIDNYPAITEEHPFVIGYTSGTTGDPKGVVLSHRSRTWTLMAMGVEWGCFGPNDDFLLMTPLFHAAGFVFLAAPLMFGGTVTITRSFDVDRAITLLSSDRHTGVFLVPTMIHRMLDSLAESNIPFPGETLKTVISNAAALPQATKEKVVNQWGEGLLHETYGATEYGIVTNIRPEDQLLKEDSVGTPFANMEAQIRDQDGRVINGEGTGLLYARGPSTFSGYWRNPAETRKAVQDGWVTVGDVARRDKDGCYYIVDRAKDMVVSGGVNIYPREIEKVLMALPDVVECAVIGVPDSEWGERLRAFVVAADSARLTSFQIIEHCRNHLASAKIPRDILFTDDLPKNASGKVLKNRLRERKTREQ